MLYPSSWRQVGAGKAVHLPLPSSPVVIVLAPELPWSVTGITQEGRQKKTVNTSAHHSVRYPDPNRCHDHCHILHHFRTQADLGRERFVGY